MSDEMSDALNADVDLTAVTASDFRGAMDAAFRLSHNGGDVDLRLVEISERSGTPRAAGAFTLLFVSAPGPFLPQAIYTLANPRLGTIDIFLVPIGPIDAGNGYEAVFG